MAIEVKSIVCPQCGDTDVNMTSESQGVCKSCGTQFAVQQQIETQNIYNEFYINTETPAEVGENTCVKSEIISEYSKDEFIRKAWIQLAKEDAPIEVFGLDFAPASENEHEILIDSLSVDVTYQTSVGYDRQEPYIDYEDYWEKEPYITTETYYDSNTRSNRTRQVTKYKDVKKQRQVTKYKTVTDWSPLSGEYSTKSVAVVENKEDQYFDRSLFMESFYGAKDDSFLPASVELAEQLRITKTAEDKVLEAHKFLIGRSVEHSLPGDHFRDLSWKVTKTTAAESELYKAPEYEASICFDGKVYIKRAFPFGPMNIVGDKIKNKISLDTVKSKMRADLEDKNKERENAIEKNISKATTSISLLTIVLFLASICVSIMRWSPTIIIGTFVIAVLSFIINTIAVKSVTKAETKLAEEENKERTARVEDEIADYTEQYKVKQRKALNDKLISLGYEPVAADEL